jgi:hypothetical protein
LQWGDDQVFMIQNEIQELACFTCQWPFPSYRSSSRFPTNLDRHFCGTDVWYRVIAWWRTIRLQSQQIYKLYPFSIFNSFTSLWFFWQGKLVCRVHFVLYNLANAHYQTHEAILELQSTAWAYGRLRVQYDKLSLQIWGL